MLNRLVAGNLGATAPMRPTVSDAMRALVEELQSEGIANPLGERLCLAFVWADLCHLSGEDVPAEVARWIDTPINRL